MSFTVTWSKLIRYTKDKVIENVTDDEKGGIYRLSVETDSSDKTTIFYVGRGKPVKGRILDHLAEDEKNDCITKKLSSKCYFRFAYVSGKNSRACAERFMYDKLTPSCNEQIPDSDPCEINLE